MLSSTDKMNNGMGLDNLLSEPQRLSAESDRLNVELESLVLDNYKIFVENLTCSVHLRAEDKKLTDLSGDLKCNIDDLISRCNSFRDKVNHFVTAHKRNRKTLQHHMQLVELLEVPQLVDACARNGFHDEALELANFVNGLERRHLLVSEVKSVDDRRSGSGVVQSIVDDVHHTMTGLRQQLLQSLTEMSSLPKEIQILSTLRKLDRMLIDRHLALERHELELVSGEYSTSDAQREVLKQQFIERSELRLQMDFLEARSIWLLRSTERKLASSGSTKENSENVENASDILNSSTLGPYGRIIEMLEVRRTAWFGIISQFNSLFIAQTNASSTLNSIANDTSTTILNAWTTSQVAQLLNELKVLLPQLDEGGSLRSVLEQALFFANRMGQVGCDFSELILPLFHNVVVNRVNKEFKDVLENFKTILLKERITLDTSNNAGESKREPQLIPLFAQQDVAVGGATELHSNSEQSSNDLENPQNLMKFPPLAFLLNCILTNLNFVRECPLLSAKMHVLHALEQLFRDLCQYLADKAAEIRAVGSKYGNDILSSAKKSNKKLSGGVLDDSSDPIEQNMDILYAQSLAYDLFPHVLLCFEAIYSTQPMKIVERIKNFKLKYSSTSVAGVVKGGSRFLVQSSIQCCELLGKVPSTLLVEGIWPILTNGTILKLNLQDNKE